MRVVAVSDTHNKHNRLYVPDGDMFIHAGDATNRGTYHELMDFLYWVNELPHTYRIFVPGNHDRDILKDLLFWRQQFPCIEIWAHDYRFIKNTMFVGSASMWSYGEPIELLPKPDVLITHNAAFNVLDSVPDESAFGIVDSGIGIGDVNILKFVKTHQPKVHLFGHIHFHGGETLLVDGTKHINLAACNEDNELERNTCLEFDI